MDTTAIHISKEAYNKAVNFARSQNTSVEKMTEKLIFTFFVEDKQKEKLKRPIHYSPELLKLVGIAKKANVSSDDLNAEKGKWEFLKDKLDIR